MRFPSGVTDQYLYFVAVDATDLKTRETGFSSFTVYRSRNGAAAAAMTTPTINETDNTNMPGVYELLLDEDMTIDSGDDSQEMCFHITHAGMAPVTRVIELYRPKITAGNTLDVNAGGEAGLDLDNTSGTIDAAQLGADCITAAKIAPSAITKGDQLAGLNDVSAADVNDQCDTALSDIGLDHLISAAVTGTDVTDNSIIAKIVSKSATADWDSFVNTTDALEAVRDHIGDGTNLTEAGGTGDQLTALATAAELAKVPKSDGTVTWNATALASIEDECNQACVDVITVDAISELGVGVPSATPNLADAVMLMYMALRNTTNVKTSYTTDAMEISNNAGTVIAHKDVTDDGSDYSEATMQSGASS